MKSYFDGSEGTDGNNSQWLTLAGYMASDALWGSFQTSWERMLKERYPIAPYIHMSEIVNREDPFERRAGWTDAKVEALLFDAVDLLQRLDKRAFCSFVCSIDLSARIKLIQSGSQIKDPCEICANWCVGKATSWYFDARPDDIELMYVFFDRGESFMKPIKNAWLSNRTPPKRPARNLFWDLIANIEEVDMEVNPPIQAADMLAWARNRSLNPKIRPFRHMHEIMSRVIPSWQLTLDEGRLRKAHPPIA